MEFKDYLKKLPLHLQQQIYRKVLYMKIRCELMANRMEYNNFCITNPNQNYNTWCSNCGEFVHYWHAPKDSACPNDLNPSFGPPDYHEYPYYLRRYIYGNIKKN